LRVVLLALLPVPPLALVATAWALRRQAAAEPAILLDLLSPDGTAVNLRSWIDFYQSLYAIATPRWKSWFIGQPWLGFELWAAEDAIRVRCWLPARLETLVTTQLRSALPGVEIRPADPGSDLTAIAARSRLRLHRDSLYPLGSPRPEPLVAVMNALTSVSEGVVQLVIQPDVGWQGQAQRRLDVLAGVRPAPLSLGSLLAGALDFLFDLVLPSQGQQSGQPKRSHSNPLPPAGKAEQPGYRAELRLAVFAPADTPPPPTASRHGCGPCSKTGRGSPRLNQGFVHAGGVVIADLLFVAAPTRRRVTGRGLENLAQHVPILFVQNVRDAPGRISRRNRIRR